MALGAAGQRLAGSVQRERLGDVDEQRTVGDQRQQPPQHVGVGPDEDVGPADLRHHLGVGDRGEPAALGQQLRSGRERVTPDQVDDGVDATGRKSAHPVDQSIAVRHRLGAPGAQHVVVGLARRPDHPGPAVQGELGGERAHPTGGGVHQDGVTIAHLSGLQQLLGGQPRQWQRGGLHELEAVGHPGHGAHRDRGALGEGAVLDVVLPVVRGNAVTNGHLADGGADREHGPGDVPAGDQRQVVRERALQVAADDLPVDGVDTRGGNIDQHRVGTDDRLVDLSGVDDVGCSELGH